VRQVAGATLTERGTAAAVAGYDLRARTAGHTDLERLRRGMVGGQFWSVYVGCELAGPGAARLPH
jgi:hypothetical protein